MHRGTCTHGQETWGRAATTKSLETLRGAAESLRGVSVSVHTTQRAPEATCSCTATTLTLTSGILQQESLEVLVGDERTSLGARCSRARAHSAAWWHPSAARWHPSAVWWHPQCSEGDPAHLPLPLALMSVGLTACRDTSPGAGRGPGMT